MLPSPTPKKTTSKVSKENKPPLKTFISLDYDEDEFDDFRGSIVGTKKSLQKLKSAIDEALEKGEASFGEEESSYSGICRVKVKDESYFKEPENYEDEDLDRLSIFDLLFIALILLSLGVGFVQIVGWILELISWIFG